MSQPTLLPVGMEGVAEAMVMPNQVNRVPLCGPGKSSAYIYTDIITDRLGSVGFGPYTLACEDNSKENWNGLTGLDEGPSPGEVAGSDALVHVDLEGIVVPAEGEAVDEGEDC